MAPLGGLFRGRGRWYLLAAGAAVAVAALVLLLPGSVVPAPQATVAGARVTIVGEGTTARDIGWFGPSTINYSGPADGYPFASAVGSTFNFSFVLINGDTHEHNVSSVAVAGPFRLEGSSPALPAVVKPLQDFTLVLVVGLPPVAGEYSLNVTVTAFG